MTLREAILAGESAELEFKEARPKEALKYVKTAVAFANLRMILIRKDPAVCDGNDILFNGSWLRL